jgi:hypothetical protein
LESWCRKTPSISRRPSAAVGSRGSRCRGEEEATVAVLVHRPWLLDDPGQVEEVATAARIALKSERLKGGGSRPTRGPAASTTPLAQAERRPARTAGCPPGRRPTPPGPTAAAETGSPGATRAAAEEMNTTAASSDLRSSGSARRVIRSVGLPRSDGQGWWLGQAIWVMTSSWVVVSNSSGVL